MAVVKASSCLGAGFGCAMGSRGFRFCRVQVSQVQGVIFVRMPGDLR